MKKNTTDALSRLMSLSSHAGIFDFVPKWRLNGWTCCMT